MAKAIHAMVRVFNLERSIRFYEAAFGLKLGDRFDFADFTLVYLRNEETDFELELTWNHNQTERYSHGSGYGHIAFCVDDIEAEHARMTQEGFEPRKLVSMEHSGKPLARLFFLTDPDGYSIEVLQKAGRYR
jgi:lactoylglutathione lyase